MYLVSVRNYYPCSAAVAASAVERCSANITPYRPAVDGSFSFFCAAAAATAVVIVVVVVTAVLFACAYCHRSFAKRKFTCRQVKWYNNVVDNCVQLHSKYTVRQYVQDVLFIHTRSQCAHTQLDSCTLYRSAARWHFVVFCLTLVLWKQTYKKTRRKTTKRNRKSATSEITLWGLSRHKHTKNLLRFNERTRTLALRETLDFVDSRTLSPFLLR